MKKFSSILLVLLLALVSFTASAQSFPRGDVDKDGIVNIADVTALIDNMLKGIAYGDVDQNGVVGIDDLTCLIDYLLKGTWPDEPVTHEWVDLGLPSGTLWATMNVGASAPEEYGDYFAWGETAPKDVYSWSTYKWCNNGSPTALTKYCTQSSYGYNGFVDNKTELDPEDDAAYVNWGSSWRMPTIEQQRELYENCSSVMTTINGVNGRLFTGPNGNTLFLPAAGGRWDASLVDAGLRGYFWSRLLCPGYSYYSDYLYYNRYGVYLGSCGRSSGFAVRAVRVSQN